MIFLLLLLALAGVVWSLRRVNLPRRLRHRQLWSPVAVLLLTAAILAAYLELYGPLSELWVELQRQAEELIGGVLPVGPRGAGVWLAANLLLLGGYAALKSVMNLPLRLRASWRSRIGLGPAYGDDPEHGVHLRAEWVFPGMLFRYAGWGVGGGLLLLMLFDAVVRPLPFALPLYPALSLLLLLEIGWYLGGEPLLRRVGEISGAEVQTRRGGEYVELWEEYQRLWPDHLLAATDRVPRFNSGSASAALPRRSGEGDEVQQAITGAWQDLLAAGHPVGDLHYQILDQLWRGRDVLVGDSSYESVAPVLFAGLRQLLINGQRVLVLLPARQRHDDATCAAVEGWLDAGLSGGGERDAVWRIARFDAFHQRGSLPDLLVASAQELLDARALQEPWFDSLRTVLFLDGAQAVFEAPMLTEALIRALRRHRADLQQIILAADRRELESAMRDNLGAQVREFRTPRSAPAAAYVLCWRLEGAGGGWFQHALLRGPERYLGAEPVLALPAWREGIRPIHLVGQAELPWAEHIEELDNHRGLLREPVPAARLPGSAHEVLEVSPLPQALRRRARAFVLAHDSGHNLAETLRGWLTLGGESSFVQVVAPPYLLRDYLAANLEYFLQAPLLPLSPRLPASRLAVAFTLLERLIASPLTERELLSELRAVEPGARHVEDTLVALFRELFGVDPLGHNLLLVERGERFDERRDAFEEVVTYRISPQIRELKALHWLRRYRILDRGERERGVIPLDHLYQTYLPGQVHAFQGKPFRIERVDHSSAIVWVDHVSAGRPQLYRAAREVTLAALRPSPNPAHRWEGTEGGWRIEIEICKGAFSVRTPRYFSFPAGLDLSERGHTVTTLDEARVPVREYRERQLLRLALTPPEPLETAGLGRIAATLCVLLQELFVTLYPETHRFLLVCAPGAAGSLPREAFAALLPSLEVAETVAQPPEQALALYFFEDSHTPLGLLASLFDARDYILSLLEDYLSWVREEEEHAAEGWRKHIPPRDEFLRFGMPASALEIAGTHAFLRRLQRDEQKTLRTARQAFYADGAADGAVEAGAGARLCDFCGEPLGAAEFETLADGRERCARCGESAIDRLPQLRQVYEEARQFITRDLGQTLRKDIQVEFASAERIHDALGERFLPTAGFDARTIGLARREGSHFSILVEQGYPHHRTLGTLVHEMTHIWQFTHLDYPRMQAAHGLLLTEGHATWAEIAALERRGLAAGYREQLASRADDYGQGYRMLLEWLRRHPQHGNPFAMLRDLYPAPKRW